MVKETIFVIGGCRSGKSRHALELAQKMKARQKVFMATCVPRDEEMKKRVARHQAERSDNWNTVEVPLKLPGAILAHSQDSDLILVDCLTLWTTNLLMEEGDPDRVETHIRELSSALKTAHCPVILVSNEVGNGIVPENDLARQFRDMVGWVNQGVAACADRVVWMVAGIPVTIK